MVTLFADSTAPNCKKALERTRRDLVAWRENHRAPQPIPNEIWASAAELGQRLGVGKVARELKLDYGSLKRRVADLSGIAQVAPSSAPAEFLELFTVSSPQVECCVLQLKSARCEATIQLHQVSPQTVGAILREVLH